MGDAATIEANVGDKLVFSWSSYHNVVQVDSADKITNCVPAGGTDLGTASPVEFVITELPVYFLCSVYGHCQSGQHLTVTEAPAGNQKIEVKIFK